MAKLTTCGTCGHQVSSTATQCPNCGQKFKKKTSIFTWAIAALFGVPFLFAIFKSGNEPNPTASEPIKTEQKALSKYETMEKYSVDETQFDDHIGSQVAVVQMLVKQQMKDPESAQFRNWHYVKASKSLPATVCGEVNGKNSFNGYTGFRHFLFKTDTTEFGIEGSTKNFEKEYNKYCVMK